MQRGAMKKYTPTSSPLQQDAASSSSSSDAGHRGAAAELELSVPEVELDHRHSTTLKHDGAGLPTPRAIFALVSCLFWTTMLFTFLQYRFQLSSISSSLSALPCNPSKRPLATCAHRANAAELLTLLQGGSSSSSSSSSTEKQQQSLQEQMSLLWSNGITCFDLDVVQLAGGDFIIGHPSDLAHKASSSSSSSSSSSMIPQLLQKHSLAELRAAGVDAAAAPALHTVLRHFAQLRRSKPPGGSSSKSRTRHGGSSSTSAAQAAVQRDSWQQLPLLALELKGPASTSADAWQDVIDAVRSAGVADSTVLWLRQPAGNSSSSSNASVVLQLAESLREHRSSRSKASAKSSGPLLGLIVPDKLLLPAGNSLVGAGGPSVSTGNIPAAAAAAAAAALLRAAAGLPPVSSSRSRGAVAVLEAFDVLAPSVRLPPALLAQLVSWKPALAWTLEKNSDVQKAMWLGLDVGISNMPVQQAAYVQQKGAGLCNEQGRGL